MRGVRRGVGRYVGEVTNVAIIGCGPMSGWASGRCNCGRCISSRRMCSRHKSGWRNTGKFDRSGSSIVILRDIVGDWDQALSA